MMHKGIQKINGMAASMKVESKEIEMPLVITNV